MKYVAFYDTIDYLHENRSFGFSSVNVVEYMAEALCDAVGEVEIISPTRTLNEKGFFRGRKTLVRKSIQLVQPPTFGVKTHFGRFFSLLFTQIWLLFYLLKNTKRGEQVVAYHSISTVETLKIAKKIKKLELVLEIREIYTDLNETTDNKKKRELNYFKAGDKYIFPTELLNEKINTENKPYVVATGIYKAEKTLVNKYDDGKIHLVYAGTFNPEKGGALVSINMALYLNENYHLHILGKDSTEIMNIVLNAINEVDRKSSATVTYDGVLRGDEFNQFLQRCHIGLSTQNPVGEYNDSSFPSKILTYLANGLDVLSIKIPAVTSSPIGRYLYYYDLNDSKNIANAVMKINPRESKDTRAVLEQLNSDLIDNLHKLLLGNS